MTELLLDIGNSRIKWALATNGELMGRAQALAHSDYPTLLADWAALEPAPRAVRCVSVAAASTLEAVDAWVAEHWSIALDRVRTPALASQAGLTLAYPQPEQLGADRWLAMRGAQYRGQLPAIIIDAGSAITVDQVDGEGQHYGGLILAGLAAQHAGLQTMTPALPPLISAAADQPPPLLATNTADALASGAINGTAAALDQLVTRLAGESAPVPNILMTGGDAPTLAAAMRTPATHYPDLVLEGLAAIARLT
jgi:pantothenate kinase, type III